MNINYGGQSHPLRPEDRQGLDTERDIINACDALQKQLVYAQFESACMDDSKLRDWHDQLWDLAEHIKNEIRKAIGPQSVLDSHEIMEAL